MLKKDKLLHIGTAGWYIPSNLHEHFPAGNSLLERYSKVFNAVEINTSFYRSHQKITYERWAAATPDDFLFSVKMPKEITHHQRLVEAHNLLDQFIKEVSFLKKKLGPILIQLPPSLKFESKIGDSFFKLLRNQFDGQVVLEPRNISWASPEALAVLIDNRIIPVVADPPIAPIKGHTEQSFEYYRLHGSPKIYTSSYDAAYLHQLANHANASSWVIFDNTKFGAATQNALDLKKL
ncbi:MAG: DUF72 domain-containing protein [Candidatus Protochlamydia sp.]|nr:DUF72 domain-containing protein [Candidatus Protochlamydia sp.]